ncbi:rCG63673 [Rattus norvegicus]|uniref:Ac2-141 n=2 Tax=Rattus norvegicus TaxID=10116 RepID=A6JVJ1_RAT|nr:Ac2-141 [Rattus norvegicus]EDM14861.1 rCG63673 [Rattus norvegicus]
MGFKTAMTLAVMAGGSSSRGNKNNKQRTQKGHRPKGDQQETKPAVGHHHPNIRLSMTHFSLSSHVFCTPENTNPSACTCGQADTNTRREACSQTCLRSLGKMTVGESMNIMEDGLVRLGNILEFLNKASSVTYSLRLTAILLISNNGTKTEKWFAGDADLMAEFSTCEALGLIPWTGKTLHLNDALEISEHAESFRRQLYQAPVSMHFLGPAILYGFGGCMYVGWIPRLGNLCTREGSKTVPARGGGAQFPDPTGLMHIRTYSDCDSMHKTYTISHHTKSQHGKGGVVTKSQS